MHSGKVITVLLSSMVKIKMYKLRFPGSACPWFPLRGYGNGITQARQGMGLPKAQELHRPIHNYIGVSPNEHNEICFQVAMDHLKGFLL